MLIILYSMWVLQATYTKELPNIAEVRAFLLHDII